MIRRLWRDCVSAFRLGYRLQRAKLDAKTARETAAIEAAQRELLETIRRGDASRTRRVRRRSRPDVNERIH